MSQSKPGGAKRFSMPFLAGTALAMQLVAGLCYPIAKYGLAIIEPFTFAFYRYLISSVILLAIVHFKKHERPVERKDWLRIISLGALIIVLNQTAYLLGQSLTGAGHGAVLFATTPVIIVVLALIHLKEKLNWRRAVGSGLAFAGVMTIMLSGALNISTDYLVGDTLILLAVIAWAYYTIIGKSLVIKYGAMRITAYALAAGSAIYFPFGLYRAVIFDYSDVTIAAWGSVLFMALGISVFVYVVWYWLLKSMEASRVAIYQNIQPVVAASFAWIFLGEQITTAFVIGGLIVLAGVIMSEA